MSFKLFVYYCALCGAWAALLAWLFVVGLGLQADAADKWVLVRNSSLVGAVLGFLLGLAIGTLDALLNSVGGQRVVRPIVCLGIGLVGAALGACVGEALYQFTPM